MIKLERTSVAVGFIRIKRTRVDRVAYKTSDVLPIFSDQRRIRNRENYTGPLQIPIEGSARDLGKCVHA